MNRIFLNCELEHRQSSFYIGQGNIDSLLQSTAHSGIQSPRKIGRTQNKHIFAVISYPLHLNQQFSLDSSRYLILLGRSLACNRIDFVDEDDAWALISCHLEESFQCFLGLAYIFRH